MKVKVLEAKREFDKKAELDRVTVKIKASVTPNEFIEFKAFGFVTKGTSIGNHINERYVSEWVTHFTFIGKYGVIGTGVFDGKVIASINKYLRKNKMLLYERVN